MKNKVFFSYSFADSQFAETIKPKLGRLIAEIPDFPEIVDVQSNLQVGTDIRKSIREAIESASAVVVLSSASSDSSEWVNYETAMADALGKPMVFVGGAEMEGSTLAKLYRNTATMVKLDDEA